MVLHVTAQTQERLPAYIFVIIMAVGLLPVYRADEMVISNHGVRPTKAGDTAIVFYANVTHHGTPNSSPLIGRLQMAKCCLNVVNGSTCDAIKLLSGLNKVFFPNHSQTLEMYFVNFDVLDREGNCTLRLLTKPMSGHHAKDFSTADTAWNKGQEITVPFKSKLAEARAIQKLMISMGWSSRGYRICSLDNKNARHECANHDCLVRYAGAMSLGDKKSGFCLPTPPCEDTKKHMISYVTGKCEETRSEVIDDQFLTKSFTNEIKRHYDPWYKNLIGDTSDGSGRSKAAIIKPSIVCTHGERVKGANNRPNCTCFPGWRSMTPEEWEHKGGNLESDGTAPIYKLCNIPTLEHRKRKILLITFLIIALLVPFAGILINTFRKRAEEKSGAGGSFLKDFMEGSSTSPDENEETELDDEGEMERDGDLERLRDVFCGGGNLEDEDLDKIIEEITNRREQKPKRHEDNDKDPPPFSSPPPPPPPAAPSYSSQESQQTMGPSNINSEASEMPPPEPSQEASASPSQAPEPESNTGLEPEKSQSSEKFEDPQLQYSSSSRGFVINQPHHDFYDRKEVNMNYPSTRSLSTDELLTMRKSEKKGAHIPMKPASTRSSTTSIQAPLDPVRFSSTNNYSSSRIQPVTVNTKSSKSSLSSEEITLRKKQQWDQFMESVYDEQLPSHKPFVHSERSHHEGVRGNELSYRSYAGVSSSYRNEPQTHSQGAAMKVRSLPEMQMSYSASMHSPPEPIVQKSLRNMQPEEYASRQQAFTLLQSLSNPRLEFGYEKETRPRPIFDSSPTSLENRPKSAKTSRTPSKEEIRVESIYGNMGSDGDSDEALESLAKNAPEKVRSFTQRQTVAERFAENQRVYTASQRQNQNPFNKQPDTFQSNLDKLLDQHKPTRFGNPFSTSSPLTSSSSDEFRPPQGSTSNLKANSKMAEWLQQFDSNPPSHHKDTQSLDPTIASRSASSDYIKRTDDSLTSLDNETALAYGIKHNLEGLLKASRSRSAANFN